MLAELEWIKSKEQIWSSTRTYLSRTESLDGICVNVDTPPPYFKKDEELIKWLEQQGFSDLESTCEAMWDAQHSANPDTIMRFGPLLGIRFPVQNGYGFIVIALQYLTTHKETKNTILYQMIIFESQPISDARLFSRVRHLRNFATKHAVIIGVGSIGSTIALELAKAGIGKLTLIDQERLSVGNIVRHTGTLKDIGRNKVDLVKDQALLHNPYMEINTLEYSIGFSGENFFRNIQNNPIYLFSLLDTPRRRDILMIWQGV
ncbi:ThiF family adenylyltransferase [Bacillus wiedmannii]|uniref:ThiF family adenylyltransferase n=1 Tax=Bacillus wiedmannii TaxID=1890302 RepID=UPI003D99FCBB